MTFEEWLESDEGVLRFGLELRPEWIADARIGWNAAIEKAALVCKYHVPYGIKDDDGESYAEAVRALSSNAALTGAGE